MRTIGWIRTHLGLGLLALLLCAAATTQAARLDADGNGAVAPATDGTLILRHLFGFTGTSLTTGALGADATRDAAAITAYLAGTGTLLDVDGDGRRDALTDGVLIKRYLLGRTGSALTLGAIAPDAARTSPAQVAAYLAAVDSVPTSNQALLGPLAGAAINAYRLSDLGTAVEGPIAADADLSNLALAGTFQLALTGIADDEWVLVTATGGQDIDAADDGVADATPTTNLGTLHALATAADWRAGGLKVSALTDIVWRYTRNLADQVSPEEVSIRLGDLLAQFIRTDLTGDGRIDLRDLLRFNPANPAHRAALNFDYQRLFTPDAQGHSIVAALHAGDETTLNALLDQQFGHTLSRFPAPDSRYQSIRVKLGSSGQGRAAAPGNLVLVDSALPAAQQIPIAFLTKDAAQSLVLTATPAAQSQILGWAGCDLVSADRTQCTIGLAGSRDILVNFGPITAIPGATLYDLSGATNTLYPDVVDVAAEPTDTALIARLALLQPNDYIVGSTGDGFLRQVTAVEQVDSTHYRLETVEAALAEVVGTAGGTLNRALTNGDLRGYRAPGSGGSAASAADAFSGRQGIRLIPSADPASPVFRLEFGDPQTAADGRAAAAGGPSIDVTLYEAADGSISAQGAVDMTMHLDFSAAFCGLGCLDHWHFIVRPTATESLTLSVTGTMGEIKRQIWVGAMNFGKLVFQIGGVPVWITPKVDFYLGIDGSIKAEWTPNITFTQRVEAGIVYNRVSGFDGIANGDFDAVPAWEDAAFTAEIKLPYLLTSASLKVYDVAGPSLPLETYLKLSAALDRKWIDDPCAGQLKISASWGVSSKFRWDLSGITKLGEILHLDQLKNGTEFEIKVFEWPLKTWYADVPCVPYLQVDGSGILASIPEGTDTTLTSTVRLTNKGEVELPWHVEYINDNPTEVTPNRGSLAPGARLDVLVSVATAGFAVGVYSNPLTFTNDYDPSRPDSETGTRQLPIRIDVTPGLSTAPVLTTATCTGPGRVQVTWTFNSAASPIPIDGYRIDTSFDGVTWNQALTVAGAGLRTAQVSGLPQGLVYLRVAAYAGQAVSPVSNVLSVMVLGAGGLLNDTGIVWCANETQNLLACPVGGYPGQDAQSGRDVTNNDDSDGHAGFSFTKLDANGNPLAASAATWSCVRDNVTGLTWEVKTVDGGLRDRAWTYSWYNPDAATNGGFPGYADYGNNCFNPARCDTQKYVADVNAQGLCGAQNWRLPDPRELMSIVSNDRISPAIDTTYFRNTVASWVWSASPYAYGPDYAWYVNFSYGYVNDSYKDYAGSVRLVRGGQ
ncbi:DUF1566 domain-containing protein [uncultured Thiodictyon sp.]|jgi:hypothetical protein|uniref:Lcl domain-containing protein n=1 Tax=uncultured Thiodictyon sp. TaxID=1846217 RepID=UPI0025FEE5C8|nr:DUF1566 domain-containing protein [uncultured Thiodictyon sp.]